MWELYNPIILQNEVNPALFYPSIREACSGCPASLSALALSLPRHTDKLNIPTVCTSFIPTKRDYASLL